MILRPELDHGQYSKLGHEIGPYLSAERRRPQRTESEPALFQSLLAEVGLDGLVAWGLKALTALYHSAFMVPFMVVEDVDGGGGGGELRTIRRAVLLSFFGFPSTSRVVRGIRLPRLLHRRRFQRNESSIGIFLVSTVTRYLG
jgi:hypothetical protein